jgi:hypothetical protein
MKEQTGEKHITSFYLAAYLFTKGQNLRAIDFDDPRRADFVFEGSKDIDDLVQQFNFASPQEQSVLVDAREFIMSIKMLKDKLYQGRA